ncbi:hypothetical protein PFDG_04941, partial [Plasmodium falciparum Dd2]
PHVFAKIIADKIEKGCLKCGGVFGGGIAPSIGTLGGIGQVALSAWKTEAIAAATAAAEKAGAAAGLKAGNAQGMAIVIKGLKAYGVHELYPELLQSIGSKIPYYDIANIAKAIITKKTQMCGLNPSSANEAICKTININFKLIPNGNQNYYPTQTGIEKGVTQVVGKATQTADFLANKVSSETSSRIISKQTALIEAGFDSSTTSIYASIIVILIIVLIMIFIH